MRWRSFVGRLFTVSGINFRLQRRDLNFECLVPAHLALQENTGNCRLFGNAVRRQQVNIAKLVLFLAKVFNVDQALGNQGVQAIVDAAKADDQCFADLRLRQVWIDFQYPHQTKIGTFRKFDPAEGN